MYIALLQALVDMPVRQWTIQDVIVISTAAAVAVGGMVTNVIQATKLGRVERASDRMTVKMEGIESKIQDAALRDESRLTKLEEKAESAHIRLDMLRDQKPIDWDRVMRVLEKAMEMQAKRESDVDHILRVLAEGRK